MESPMSSIFSLIAVCLFACIHLFISKCRFLYGKHGHIWLAISSGVAIAYIFAHLLPDIAVAQVKYSHLDGISGFIAKHLFLVTLSGLILYYGFDRVTEYARGFCSNEHHPKIKRLNRILHVIGWAIYNFLVGYLVTTIPRAGVEPTLIITFIMIVHFLGLNFHFREVEQHFYDRYLRWVLALSVMCGWFIAQVTHFSALTKIIWFAFLTGAILINTLKEELPDGKTAHFLPFVASITVFTSTMLAIEAFFPKINND
jgi:uncharacterized membrane protein